MNTSSLGANSKRVVLLNNSKSANNPNHSSGPMTTSGPGANSQRIEPQNPINNKIKIPIPLAHMSMQRIQYNPKLTPCYSSELAREELK
jgi:hypothetical protein